LWKACALNAGTWVLMMDMRFLSGDFEWDG
jgi:hypothetical protein